MMMVIVIELVLALVLLLMVLVWVLMLVLWAVRSKTLRYGDDDGDNDDDNAGDDDSAGVGVVAGVGPVVDVAWCSGLCARRQCGMVMMMVMMMILRAHVGSRVYATSNLNLILIPHPIGTSF
jgi:hypothetical protein